MNDPPFLRATSTPSPTFQPTNESEAHRKQKSVRTHVYIRRVSFSTSPFPTNTPHQKGGLSPEVVWRHKKVGRFFRKFLYLLSFQRNLSAIVAAVVFPAWPRRRSAGSPLRVAACHMSTALVSVRSPRSCCKHR